MNTDYFPLISNRNDHAASYRFMLFLFLWFAGSANYLQADGVTEAIKPLGNIEQPLLVSHAYMVEPTPVSRSGAVYVTLTNPSAEKIVTVTSIQTELAAHSMIHQTSEQNNTVKMKSVNQLVFKPHQTIELAPNGLHVMLMGLSSRPLANPFELWLTFDDGSKQKIMVIIQPLELN